MTRQWIEPDAYRWLDVGRDPRVLDGFWVVNCDDCDGTGIFRLPDDSPEPCVACKATGHAVVCLARL